MYIIILYYNKMIIIIVEILRNARTIWMGFIFGQIAHVTIFFINNHSFVQR